MQKEKFLARLEELSNENLATARAKNDDYTGGNDDAFANFTTSERLGVATEIGMMIRMSDKWERLLALTTGREPSVKDESLLDTLSDLANYCQIMRVYLEDQQMRLKPVDDAHQFKRTSMLTGDEAPF